jgi:hypothetical protein
MKQTKAQREKELLDEMRTAVEAVQARAHKAIADSEATLRDSAALLHLISTGRSTVHPTRGE